MSSSALTLPSAAPAPPEVSPVRLAEERPPVAFLSRRVPLSLIFGSFLFMTVPLLYLAVWRPGVGDAWMTVYFIGTSLTHFFITGALYADAAHLKFFRSSLQNKLTYFVAPVAILVFVFALGTLRVDPQHGYEPDFHHPGTLFWAFFWLAAVVAVDTSHSTRQTFGVLQMMKAQPGLKFSSWTKDAEKLLFLFVGVMELSTFLTEGRFNFANWGVRALLAITSVLALTVLAGFVQALRTASRPRALLIPFTYLLFQGISAGFVVWHYELYFIALAMHNVEYHVLMVPRLAVGHAKRTAGAAGRIDPVWKAMAVTYALVLVGALWCFGGQGGLSAKMSQQQLVWTAACVFNGIFLAHYFVERSLWKFSNPFLRETLGPVYFPKRKKA